MRRRTCLAHRAAAGCLVLAATLPAGAAGLPSGAAAAPASLAAELSSIRVDRVTVADGALLVTGTVAYGPDALGPVTVSTGTPSSPHLLPGHDIGDLTIETDLAAARLLFTLELRNGLAVQPHAPPRTWWVVPYGVDGRDHNSVLVASVAGDQPLGASGDVRQDAVRWRHAFAHLAPPASYGSVIDAGWAVCGKPCVGTNASTFGGPVPGFFAATKQSTPMEPFKVPGEVQLGVAPAGTPSSQVDFSAEADFSPATGTFAGAVPTPTTRGLYTVWARTCYGLWDVAGFTCATAGRVVELPTSASQRARSPAGSAFSRSIPFPAARAAPEGARVLPSLHPHTESVSASPSPTHRQRSPERVTRSSGVRPACWSRNADVTENAASCRPAGEP